MEGIKKEIENSKNNFNKQIRNNVTVDKDKENTVIELTAENPEYKELLKFIMHVVGNNHTFNKITNEIFSEAIVEHIDISKKIVEKIEKLEHQKKSIIFSDMTFKGFVGFVKDTKVILIFIGLIILGLGLLIKPVIFTKLIALMAK